MVASCSRAMFHMNGFRMNGGFPVKKNLMGFACFSMVSAMALMAGHGAAYAQQAEAKRNYDITAQPLASALVELSRQGDVVVTAQADLTRGRPAPAIRGYYTVAEALRALLAGSGLYFQRSAGGAYVITGGHGGDARTGKGIITGRVIDPATGDYKRDAIIRIVAADGQRRTVTSEEGGQYRITDVAAGPAILSISFTGYESQSQTVDVVAGQALPVDFALHVPRSAEGGAAGIVVTGVREGDARAIMSQRKSMNITNNLSSESFGEISEGNIGEFLKFMPGVSTQGQADDTVRYVSLRGLPPEYAAVTVNGVSIAGADATDSDTSSRAFSFEQASLSSIDSIEISKTISADVDANAPAGTINLRTKRAFDRKGRRIIASLIATTQSDLWDGKRSGPKMNGSDGRFRPSGSIEFSDVFMDGRLGVLASVSQSNTHTEMETIQNGWNYVPTAASPDPMATATLMGRVISQEVSRFSANMTVDFKATDSLTLSMMGIYNRSYNLSDQRSYTFTSGARTRGVDGDPAFDFTTNHLAATNSVSAGSNTIAKKGNGLTLVPSFELRTDRIIWDGNLSYSRSESSYDPMGEEGAIFSLVNAPAAKGNFSAQRDRDYLKSEWTIRQQDGADWSDPASYSMTSILLNTQDGRSSTIKRKGAQMNLTVDLPTAFAPITLKTGFKLQRGVYTYDNEREAHRYRYVGPLSLLEFLTQNQSDVPLNFNESNFDYASLSGSSSLYMPNNYKIGHLFRTNPELFEHVMTAANYYNAYVANSRHFEEDTNAAFAMATSRPAEWLMLRGGLRWEETRTSSLEPDALSAAEMEAAGYAVSASTGRATTVEGMIHQYQSRPRTARKGRYDYFFPSASAKVSFTPNTDLHFGYSRTIRRAPVNVLAGVWSVNETTQTVTAPNPGLTPEFSDNFSVRLAHYFEPVGLVAINLFQNKLKGAFQTQEFTAEEFGYTGTEYADYIFRTTTKVGDGTINIKGVELEFNYSLERLLPGPFKGLTLRGSYTYTKPNEPIALTPRNMATLALSYKTGPLRLYLNSVWTDDRIGTISTGTYDKARLDMNLSGSYRITKGWQAFFAVRNLLNKPVYRMGPGRENSGGTIPDHTANYNNAGVSGTIGIRATF